MSKNQPNPNVPLKFKTFLENWLKEEKNRTPQREIFRKDSFDNKTPSTIRSQLKSLNGSGRSKKNTIKPAYALGKSKRSAGYSATEPRLNPKTLFISKPKVNKLDKVSIAGNKSLRLQTDSKLASKPKRKCKSTRNERYEKLMKLRNSSANGFENSSESCSSIQNSQSSLLSNKSAIPKINDVDPYDYDNASNKDIPEKNVRRRSSFYLQSPKLFPNGYKSNLSNRSTDSSTAVTTCNDYDMETSEITPSESSFPAYQSGFKSGSAMQANYPEISTPLRNDYTSPSTGGICSQRKMRQNRILSWILPANNVSECDTTMFSDDDCMSSIGFSPLCCGTPLESACSSASDAERQVNNSMTFPTTPRNCNHGSNDKVQPDFLLDSFTMKEKGYGFSPERENSLPFKKRQTQWCSFLDSLESALTTSMEKLNEIKSDF